MALKRGARYVLVGAAVLAVTLLVLLLIFTRTEFGVERAGQVALDRIRSSINGELEVGRVASAGLLSGVTLHDVAITGPDGRAFLAADSARLAYRFRTLVGGALAFDRLTLYSPTVTIEQLPAQEEWNFERIFPPDTAAAADTLATNQLVLIRDATVHGGEIIIRMPFETDEPVAPEDTARLLLESVPGGVVRVFRLAELEARLPRIVWEAPGEEARLVEIAELATRAYLFEGPPAEVRSLEGVVTIRDSLISFDAPRVRLPDSELAAVGRIITGEEIGYDIELDGQDVAFSDFQWLYPPLPSDGGGTLQLRMQTRDPGSTLWLARDARLRTRGTEVAGSFGVVTGDTLYFTNVDLEASPLDLDLIQSLVPGDLPIEGLLIGTIEVEGPISALETRGDVRFRTFREGEGAESTIRWSGTVSGRPPYEVRSLTADVRALDLEQVAQFAPELRVRGHATGRIRADGSLEHGLQLSGEVALDREGGRSQVEGAGRFALGGGRSDLDLRFDAEPFALQLLTEQFPRLGRLAGAATGPVVVRGSLDDLRVDADLMTPAGAVVVQGTFGLMGDVPRYRAQGTITDFQLHRVAERLPETVVTGRFELDGEGDRLETIDTRGAIEVLDARVAGVQVRRSTIRGHLSDGLLRLDTFTLSTEVGTAEAAGSFGLLAGRSGEMAFSANAGALSFLEPVLFPEPRPAIVGREPTERLAGNITAQGVLRGSLDRWSVVGTAGARGLVYEHLRVGTGAAEFDWSPEAVAVQASVDSVQYQGRELPHARATVNWSPSGGRIVARARGPGPHRVDLEGGFTRSGEALELRLRQLALTTRDGRWAIADTVRARVGADGFRVDSLALLRSPRYARIRVSGSLPWRRQGQTKSLTAAMAIDLDSVRIGELLRVAQIDTIVDGVLSGRFRVSGTAVAPRLEGRLTARPFRYGAAELDSAGGEVTYDDRMLRTRFAGWRGAEAILSGTGTVPVELALTGHDERLLDRPMSVRVQAHGVPAALVAFLAPGFTDVAGQVDGEVAMVGTPQSPAFEGELRLTDGTAFFEPLNVRYNSMTGTARMGTGKVVEIDTRLVAGTGSGHVRGTVDLTDPRDPRFNLAVAARNLEATRRRDIRAVASGQVRLSGRYTRPVLSGDIRVLSGEMNLDELWRQYQIVQLDASLFQMFDSAAVHLGPRPDLIFINNLILTDASVQVDRGFWLRSRELNAEVTGSLDIEMDAQVEDLRLTGTMEALEGDYALQLVRGVPARTFEIRGGSVDFLGIPGVNPDLDIEAGYRIRRAQGDPIDVVARVTGTLKDPRVGLSSDSDLPLTESDLTSYILFGRSGAELTQTEADVVSSGIGLAGLGLVRPMATSLASTMAQQALNWTGLPVDHVAFTTAEYGLDRWQEGILGVLDNAQVEVGIDATRDLSFIGTYRIPTNGTASGENSAFNPNLFGARMEWRFRPTWTSELYVEDRFARTPSFGLTEIDDRKVIGLSVFREWGY